LGQSFKDELILIFTKSWEIKNIFNSFLKSSRFLWFFGTSTSLCKQLILIILAILIILL